MSKALLIFLDGVGIGEKDESKNPFFSKGFRTFEDLFGGAPFLEEPVLRKGNKIIFPIDASLGIKGLPQSGTGQAAIFTGENAPALAGKHFGPFPHSTSIKIIKEKNIFTDLIKKGLRSFFANAYPQLFFDYVNSGKKRINVTALMALESGVGLRTIEDLQSGNALSNEITNYRWAEKLKEPVEIIEPAVAAERLINLSLKNDLTLFEFYLTDHLGHWRLKEEFEKIWSILDEFLLNLLSKLPQEITLLICSDHGNVEDLSVKSHTLNPALGIAAGANAEKLFNNIGSLTDIKNAILNLF